MVVIFIFSFIGFIFINIFSKLLFSFQELVLNHFLKLLFHFLFFLFEKLFVFEFQEKEEEF